MAAPYFNGTLMSLCPCGSKTSYSLCCEKYLKGEAVPETPEALMRSRYTAYTKADVEYLANTQREPATQDFNPEETRKFAKRAKWLDLSILKAPAPENNTGFVEFLARYLQGGKMMHLHERSEFHLIDGQWYYVAAHTPHGGGCAC